uniref:Uncharacterized protein n=1 Tax=viral metagenome TaxID=1070528 RepID=A0A6M3ILF3_9ZZZZ
MLTINDTALNDNQIVWIVKITISSSTIFYFSTAEDKITLSGTDFDGEVIFQQDGNHLSDINKEVELSDGGGVGNRGNFSFGLSRHNSYTGASNFFNSFYPATSGNYLSGRKVEVGLLWEGATTTGEITWFGEYYINDYSFDDSQINLFCLEYDEFVDKIVPYYKTQNNYDNGISYFTTLLEDEEEVTIPIVYGDLYYADIAVFLQSILYNSQFTPVGTVPIYSAQDKYIIASHKLHTVGNNSGQYQLYNYIDSLNVYQQITSSYTAVVNVYGSCIIQLLTSIDMISGELFVKLKKLSQDSAIYNIIGAVDNNDDLTYTEITGGERLALKVSGNVTKPKVGILGTSSTDVKIYFYVAPDTAVATNFTINYYNRNLETPGGPAGQACVTPASTTIASYSYDIGDHVTYQVDGLRPWEIEELLSCDFWITNDEAAGTKPLRIYGGYIAMYNIISEIRKHDTYAYIGYQRF